MDYLYIAAGLVLLFLGGEALVRGAVVLARRLGLSALLIGLTVVAFGTSSPELVVSVDAALSGSSDIALGNIVGSNIANILVILAVAALIAPITNWQPAIRRDALVMVGVSALLLVLVQAGEMGFAMGLGLILALLGYVVVTYQLERRQMLAAAANEPHTVHEQETEDREDVPLSMPLAILAVIGGLGLLMGGAHLLVEGAISIARAIGLSEAVIGLTIVAVGTSLPELAASAVAAFRRHPDVAIGNVVGSNIFNILGILGITAMVKPISVSEGFRTFDVPVMLGVAIVLAALLFMAKTIGRVTALLLIAGYGMFVIILLR